MRKLLIISIILGMVLIAGCTRPQQEQNKVEQSSIQKDIKFCNTNDECGLLTCSGCYSREFLKTAPVDLPCMVYQGYHCECIENECKEIK